MNHLTATTAAPECTRAHRVLSLQTIVHDAGLVALTISAIVLMPLILFALLYTALVAWVLIAWAAHVLFGF